MHLAGGRIVLDQLDQLVAEHDLAARRRHGLADDEIAGPRAGLAGRQQRASSRCTSSASRTRNSRRRSATPSAALRDWSRQNSTATACPASAAPRTRRSPRSAAPRRARRWSRCATIARRSRNACAIRLNGGRLPLRRGEAPVLRLRLDQGPRPLSGREDMLRGFEEPARAVRRPPGKYPFAAAATPPDAKPSRYRPATAPPAICRRSSAPASRETLDRPDRPRPAAPGWVSSRTVRGSAGTTAPAFAIVQGHEPGHGNLGCIRLWQGRHRLHGFHLFHFGRIIGRQIHDSRSDDQSLAVRRTVSRWSRSSARHA